VFLRMSAFIAITHVFKIIPVSKLKLFQNFNSVLRVPATENVDIAGHTGLPPFTRHKWISKN
jgi:hypothetical protein